jgi:hypothetical protein
MNQAAIALALSVWKGMGLVPNSKIAEKIVSVIETRSNHGIAPVTHSPAEDIALIAYYIGKESGVSLHPRGESWDAKDGISCGILQMKCEFVRHASIEQQISTWLSWVESSNLGSVDSDPKRAARRARKAQDYLRKAIQYETKAEILDSGRSS